MRIVTLQSCESTNTTLKEMLAVDGQPEGYTVVRAVSQTHGRGQRGNHWEAEPGKNLTFSVLVIPNGLTQQRHFLLSEAVALAVVKFLGYFIEDKDRVRIKWPNDIHVDGRKIAGILIENSLDTDGSILHSIIGIGLNINQTSFSEGAPDAVSLSQLTGKTYNLSEMMELLGNIIEETVSELEVEIATRDEIRPSSQFRIEKIYHDKLWRKEGLFLWKTPEGECFEAGIKEIEPTGRMILREVSGKMRGFWFKEVFPA